MAKSSAHSKPSLSDSDFSAAIATELGAITPLPADNRVRHPRFKPAPIPEQFLADEADALHASRTLSLDDDWQAGSDLEAEQSFVQSGLRRDMLTDLRRGKWKIQAELDLHHHTSLEAHAALLDFFALAKKQQWRFVCIIHGKGLSSPGREPVLKNKVRRWLQKRVEVLAYCEPPAQRGGSGAVLVLLAFARPQAKVRQL